ncbi:MAG: EAL domain-containing protein [Solirubrobacteraceae bacterium]|nr:EAL domain-containing protein [Solirubrobacteraceae bacterium]
MKPVANVVGVTHWRRHYTWATLAFLIVIAGVVSALLVAAVVANNDRERSQRAVERASAEIVSTLKLSIQREQDLVISTGAFLVRDPDMSNAEFRGWTRSIDAFTRYPELGAIGLGVFVPAKELSAFAAKAVTDPAGRLGEDGSFEVVPAGARSHYCFPLVGQKRPGGLELPAGTDFCEGALSAETLSARDSGEASYVPFGTGPGKLLSVQTPLYRGGVMPTTVDARRKQFLGWVGMLTAPSVLFEHALAGHPGTVVEARYGGGASGATFASSEPADGAQSTTVDLRNGWTITTSSVGAAGGVFTNARALSVLGVGVTLSLLLGALVIVLATGRVRALHLVREKTRELRHNASHDALTGLPNRALISDRIERLLAHDRDEGTTGAALFLDLDEFKSVNDTLGHEAGDQLLVAVAARMQDALREADTIGRMGGDEFVILLDGGDGAVAPEQIAERLIDVMRSPFALDAAAGPVCINTSIGIASTSGATGESLLRDADVALYHAKAAGKNQYAVFAPEMRREFSRQIDLESDLRSAVESDQFRLVYQPIYAVDDLDLLGVEALLRWEHPTSGLVWPDAFIPVLERTGLIREVGRWALHTACRQMATWHARGHVLDLSVNVSGRQLEDDTILADVRDALDRSGLPATSLILEVTESVLMRDPEATMRRLRELRALGLRISVDDFGTGYSSLSRLHEFPVDCLKIDRTFTDALATSDQANSLVRTLVQFGDDLGVTTLAEGIETSAQLELLRDAHVQEGQGFLLAHPMTPEAIELEIFSPLGRHVTGLR